MSCLGKQESHLAIPEVANVSFTEIELIWMNESTDSNWYIYLIPPDITPQTIGSGNSSFTLQNLTPGTIYSIYLFPVNAANGTTSESIPDQKELHELKASTLLAWPHLVIAEIDETSVSGSVEMIGQFSKLEVTVLNSHLEPFIFLPRDELQWKFENLTSGETFVIQASIYSKEMKLHDTANVTTLPKPPFPIGRDYQNPQQFLIIK